MKNKIRTNHNHTLYACFTGYFIQALVTNFVPLLFLTFQREFGISFEKISTMITFNFVTQLFIDFFAAGFVDRIGYRACIVTAHLCSSIGLFSLAFLPNLLPNPFYGLVCSTIIYAIGSGLMEVLISPIVEACPTKRKKAAMGLLHSFYCWGQATVILFSTLFFVLFGIQNWKFLACIWGVIPLINALYFTQVPISALHADGENLSIKGLACNQTFWFMIILMICAGACEHGVSQWASAFAESSLKVSKAIGDLAGPCAFGILMGISRVIYAKFSEQISLYKYMLGCGLLCLTSYLLAALTNSPVLGLLGCALCGFSVGVMWPGSFSLASRNIPGGGTAMFAFLALSGDIGCSLGPVIVGLVSGQTSGNMKSGLLSNTIFPAFLIFTLIILMRRKQIRD